MDFPPLWNPQQASFQGPLGNEQTRAKPMSAGDIDMPCSLYILYGSLRNCRLSLANKTVFSTGSSCWWLQQNHLLLFDILWAAEGKCWWAIQRKIIIQCIKIIRLVWIWYNRIMIHMCLELRLNLGYLVKASEMISVFPNIQLINCLVMDMSFS